MSKTKKNVIKLVMTADESRKWKKSIVHKKKILDDSDDEKDAKIDAPKAILQKAVGETTQIVTPGDGIISKMFTYEEADVLVFGDENKKVWYKGKDVATILEYVNTKAALINNVSKKYKKTYQDLRVSGNDPLKLHPKTIFINNSGLFQLISRSKKITAVELWEFITEEVLPELFTTGTCSLPAKQSDIDRLNKSFYDDNMISDYKNKLAVYLAYIGKYKGKHVLKFGKTNDFVTRDLKQHRKMYKKFNVIKIWETLANDLVENNIKDNFLSKNMLTALTKEELEITCKEKKKRELVILNEVNDLNYCIDMIETVVKTTIIPQEQQYKEKIKELTSQQYVAELKHKNNLLETENAHLKEMNQQLKDNIKDLRKPK